MYEDRTRTKIGHRPRNSWRISHTRYTLSAATYVIYSHVQTIA